MAASGSGPRPGFIPDIAELKKRWETKEERKSEPKKQHFACCWYPLNGGWLAEKKANVEEARKHLHSLFPEASNIRYEDRRKVFHLSYREEKERNKAIESEKNRREVKDYLRACVCEVEQGFASCGVNPKHTNNNVVLVFQHPNGFFGARWSDFSLNRDSEKRKTVIQEAEAKMREVLPHLRVDRIHLRLVASMRALAMRLNSAKDMEILREGYQRLCGVWGSSSVRADFGDECGFGCNTKHAVGKCWLTQPALSLTWRFTFNEKVFPEWVKEFDEEARKKGAVRVFSGLIPNLSITDQPPSMILHVEWQREEAEKKVEDVKSALAALVVYAHEKGVDTQKIEEVSRHSLNKGECGVCGEKHAVVGANRSRVCLKMSPEIAVAATNVQAAQAARGPAGAGGKARESGAVATDSEAWRWCLAHAACFRLLRHGQCYFGARCKFLHVEGLRREKKVTVLPWWVHERVRPPPVTAPRAPAPKSAPAARPAQSPPAPVPAPAAPAPVRPGSEPPQPPPLSSAPAADRTPAAHSAPAPEPAAINQLDSADSKRSESSKEKKAEGEVKDLESTSTSTQSDARSGADSGVGAGDGNGPASERESQDEKSARAREEAATGDAGASGRTREESGGGGAAPSEAPASPPARKPTKKQKAEAGPVATSHSPQAPLATAPKKKKSERLSSGRRQQRVAAQSHVIDEG